MVYYYRHFRRATIDAVEAAIAGHHVNSQYANMLGATVIITVMVEGVYWSLMPLASSPYVISLLIRYNTPYTHISLHWAYHVISHYGHRHHQYIGRQSLRCITTIINNWDI